jgi:hypothetical protein
VSFLYRKCPDFPRRTVAIEKHILIVFWNPDGFHIVTILPRRAWFNTAWFIDGNFVSSRDQFFPGGRRPDQKKPMYHIVNASPCSTDDATLFHA